MPLDPTPSDLACPVRGCGRPLVGQGRALACAAGHSFDRARSGYVNLLQPHERRSRTPGDALPALRARARLEQRGFGLAHVEPLLDGIARRAVGVRAWLEIGAGSGASFARCAARVGGRAYGLDLSVHAVEHAARRFPLATWLVANADHRLPFADAALDLALSLRAPRPAAELARVLAPGALLVLGVPGPEDLVELRGVLYGSAPSRPRDAQVLEEFAAEFELVERRTVSERHLLDRPALEDLQLATYRGARHRERERARDLAALEVTFQTDLLALVRARAGREPS